MRIGKLQKLVERYRSHVAEIKLGEVIPLTSAGKIWNQIMKSQQWKDTQAGMAEKVTLALKNKLKAYPHLDLSCWTKWFKPEDLQPEINVNAKSEDSDEVGDQLS